MRLGYNSNGWRAYPLNRASHDLAELGYEGLELWCHPVHVDIMCGTPEDLAAARAAIVGGGLQVSNLHAGVVDLLGAGYEPTLMAARASDRRRRIDFLCAAIDAAGPLGTDLVTLHSGFAPPDLPARRAWDNLVDGMRRCLERARARGVRLMFEPEPGMLVESVTDFLRLAADLDDDPALGLNLDVGHAQCVYEDAPAIIRELGDRIGHVHVEDIADRVHRHLVPGEGSIDFAAIWAALEEVGYSGFASVELWDHADDPRAAASAAANVLAPLGAVTVHA
jgi:sugar phosphate isomerase/epimerase